MHMTPLHSPYALTCTIEYFSKRVRFLVIFTRKTLQYTVFPLCRLFNTGNWTKKEKGD